MVLEQTGYQMDLQNRSLELELEYWEKMNKIADIKLKELSPR